MIFDCFIYAGEAHLLEFRLKTLAAVVDRFLICEVTRTFVGKERVISLDRDMFPEFADQIVHVVIDDMDPHPQSAWHNEYFQRNALVRGLSGIGSNDLIILSDVDEIPNPAILSQYRPDRYYSAVLQQRMFYCALNNEIIWPAAGDLPWAMAKIATFRPLTNWYGDLQNLRSCRGFGRGRALKWVWNRIHSQTIQNGGWHFSYLMTVAQIQEKLASFSHQEFNVPQFANDAHIRQCLVDRRDLFGRDAVFRKVLLDGSFPAPVQAEPDRYHGWLN